VEGIIAGELPLVYEQLVFTSRETNNYYNNEPETILESTYP
jgi:hypothetical protein